MNTTTKSNAEGARELTEWKVESVKGIRDFHLLKCGDRTIASGENRFMEFVTLAEAHNEAIRPINERSEWLALIAKRYLYLRDAAFLKSPDCRSDFAKLANVSGEEFDRAIDSLMATP